MLCVPTASVEVVKVAVPPLSVPVPRSRWHVLEGDGAGGRRRWRGGRARPVAVRVTDCPETEGLAVAASVVLVAAVVVGLNTTSTQ